MESMYEFTIRNNKELSQNIDVELVHYLETKEYSTHTGNRTSIGTIVIQALRKNGKLFNKVQIKEISTDLIRNYSPTKSTKETHNEKVEKLKKEFSNLIEISQQFPTKVIEN